MSGDNNWLVCQKSGCSEPRVSGSQYCDDHTIQQQVQDSTYVRRPPGKLADIIRGAVKEGLIEPETVGPIGSAGQHSA